MQKKNWWSLNLESLIILDFHAFILIYGLVNCEAVFLLQSIIQDRSEQGGCRGSNHYFHRQGNVDIKRSKYRDTVASTHHELHEHYHLKAPLDLSQFRLLYNFHPLHFRNNWKNQNISHIHYHSYHKYQDY